MYSILGVAAMCLVYYLVRSVHGGVVSLGASVCVYCVCVCVYMCMYVYVIYIYVYMLRPDSQPDRLLSRPPALKPVDPIYD